MNKSSGKVKVFGYDTDTDMVNAKRQLGLVPQEFNFNPFETVLQIVLNQAGYYGVPRKVALERAKTYLTQLDLWEKKMIEHVFYLGNETAFNDCACINA